MVSFSCAFLALLVTRVAATACTFDNNSGTCTTKSDCADTHQWRKVPGANDACPDAWFGLVTNNCCFQPTCSSPAGAGKCVENCPHASYTAAQQGIGCQQFSATTCCPNEPLPITAAPTPLPTPAPTPPSTPAPTPRLPLSLLKLPNAQMNFDTTRSTVVATGANSFLITLRINPDNNTPGLGRAFRYWYHFSVQGLPSSGVNTLNVRVVSSDLGYASDPIRPVFSVDRGENWARQTGAYAYSSQYVSYTIQTPSGVSDVRIAKFYPYSIPRRDAFFNKRLSSPHMIQVPPVAVSNNGLDIVTYQIGTGPRQIWIHSGSHPAETTSYFVVEGFVDFMLSELPLAKQIRDRCTIHLLPMINPDGVDLGNARTNAKSQNLEPQYKPPYTSDVGRAVEAAGIKRKIEELMGKTIARQFPIELLLNLHSTHQYDRPLHFRHTVGSVERRVYNRENRWINLFKKNSPYVGMGPTLSSSLNGRAYVESFMHDKYSKDAQFNVSTMAITFEGVYVQESDHDYVQIGKEMGQTVGDFMFPQCNTEGARCEARTLCQSVATASSGMACPNEQIGANGGFICCADNTAATGTPAEPFDPNAAQVFGPCTSPTGVAGECIDAAKCLSPKQAFKTSQRANGCQAFAVHIQCCAGGSQAFVQGDGPDEQNANNNQAAPIAAIAAIVIALLICIGLIIVAVLIVRKRANNANHQRHVTNDVYN